MGPVIKILAVLMDRCLALTGNYGLAIILFTFISKIVLLPVSVWVQLNSIKIVRIQPEINALKARFYGDNDTFSEEQLKLYKREGYHPLLSVIPLIIQIILLIGLISVINLKISDPASDLRFLAFDLGLRPFNAGGIYFAWPIIAGLSAFLLSLAQNSSNVLQSEQSSFSKYSMTVFTVSISLFLGAFVAAGVALYWISSNLFSILQLYSLNFFINPKKHVDYEALEKSREKLRELDKYSGEKKEGIRGLLKRDPYSKKEKADYKRFFSVTNKHLVFYSETSGYYKYMGGYIEYILKNTNITVHYITSDPKDKIFELEKEYENLKAYYIGFNRLIVLMMKLDADVVCMTMTDLENFQYKRSYVRKDTEYIHIPHELSSRNLTTRTGSLDHYDTIFCAGKHQVDELRAQEAVYGLPEKKVVEAGYPLLDDMKRNYKPKERKEGEPINILIAPSWQPENIIDSCLTDLLDDLTGKGHRITVRPHPQHVRLQPDKMEELKARYSGNDDIEIQTDFSATSTVFEADFLITDWSGIAFEYAYTTFCPVIFIETPMKVMNPHYQDIDVPPMNIWGRDVVGKRIPVSDAGNISSVIKEMEETRDTYRERIENMLNEYVYNPGHSSEVGGDYIISAIKEKIRKRKEG